MFCTVSLHGFTASFLKPVTRGPWISLNDNVTPVGEVSGSHHTGDVKCYLLLLCLTRDNMSKCRGERLGPLKKKVQLHNYHAQL